MASFKEKLDKNGNRIYEVQASNGRGRRVWRTFRPEPTWSKRTIQRELQKFAAELEQQLADGEVLTREEKRAWLDTMTGVALGSDAFFPFGDNIERAHKSGVSYIAQPGGSVRDDHVISTCDKYNMAMAFTGIRLFHH